MKIELSPYNSDWPIVFRKEKALISQTISTLPHQIEHIGSTSVPGLSAKPIIDILLGLENFSNAPRLVEQMTAVGYDYISRWEDTFPERRLFTVREGARQLNIHSVEIGIAFWERHLLFRDHLRSNPADREAYQALKMDLAQREWEEVSDYAQAKNDFIRAMERKAQQNQAGA